MRMNISHVCIIALVLALSLEQCTPKYNEIVTPEDGPGTDPGKDPELPDDGRISQQLTSFDDDLVATDALGRTLPDYSETGGLRVNHHVGLFYWLWHGDLRNNSREEWDYNVTESNKLNPQRTDWQFADYYWAKPELGYYRSNDRFVLQKHMNLFCLMGIDFLYLDFTNNMNDVEELKALLEVMQEFKRRGYNPPRLVPFFNAGLDGPEGNKPYSYMERFYNTFIKNNPYPDCWFIYEGKPLIFAPEKHPTNSDLNNAFTWRRMWASFGAEDKTRWRFFDSYVMEPRGPHPSYDEAGKLEQMVVSKGLGAPIWDVMTYGGSSSTTSYAPVYNEQLIDPENTGKGLYFEEQARQALRYEPPILCITGWNEWKAGAWPADAGLANAQMKFRGVPVQVGTFYFVDEFNEEFNRDFEPQDNPQYSDNCYYQLASFIRRYKGMRIPSAVSDPKEISVSGSFSQWSDVLPVFRDFAGELRTRDNAGAPKGTHYSNFTARNDIVESRVTYDDNNIYFYVKTDAPLTSWSDSNWMMLYIDTDKDKASGWEGYDFVVNMEVKSESETTLKQRIVTGWKTIATCPMKISGNEIMIAVSRYDLLQDRNKPSFYFHWVDNTQKLDDIQEFFVNGESAPERRYNYYYNAK